MSRDVSWGVGMGVIGGGVAMKAIGAAARPVAVMLSSSRTRSSQTLRKDGKGVVLDDGPNMSKLLVQTPENVKDKDPIVDGAA